MKGILRKFFSIGSIEYFLYRLAVIFLITIGVCNLIAEKRKEHKLFTVLKLSNPAMIAIDQEIDEYVYHCAPVMQYTITQDELNMDIVSYTELKIGSQIDLFGKIDDTDTERQGKYILKALFICLLWIGIEVRKGILNS